MVKEKGAPSAPPGAVDGDKPVTLPEDCSYCPMPAVGIVEWSPEDREPVCIYHQVVLEAGMGLVEMEISAVEDAYA